MLDNATVQTIRDWAKHKVHSNPKRKPFYVEFSRCPIDDSVICQVFCRTGNPLTDLNPIATTVVSK